MKQTQRYIPKGYEILLEDAELNCVIYSNDNVAMAFSGRRMKSDFHYRFDSEERMRAYVDKHLESLWAHKEEKEKRKATMNRPSELQVGDILENSWGYDQTNIDYYQVISRTEKSVKVRAIVSQLTTNSSGPMSGYCVPVKDEFSGHSPVLTKRVYNGVYVSMKHGGCSKWNGKPSYCSWYA